MKTEKKILKSVAVIMMGALFFTSCIDDPEPIALDALADVYVQKVVQDSVEMYGISFWVFGNKELESVTVEGPEDETWTLESNESNSQVFSLYAETDEYAQSFPEPGNYSFTVTSTQTDEAPRVITDKLEEDELDAVVVDSIRFADSKLEINWQEVEDADACFVRLYDESDKLIFMSQKLDGDETEFAFGNANQGWTDSGQKATIGENYRLEVLAVLYESGSAANNADYNVQFISLASAGLVWGE
jgi:hypothetical protein